VYTEKILTSRTVLKGERQQVTVCFAAIKDTTETIKDGAPEVDWCTCSTATDNFCKVMRHAPL
jgi:hypothetical protein